MILWVLVLKDLFKANHNKESIVRDSFKACHNKDSILSTINPHYGNLTVNPFTRTQYSPISLFYELGRHFAQKQVVERPCAKRLRTPSGMPSAAPSLHSSAIIGACLNNFKN